MINVNITEKNTIENNDVGKEAIQSILVVEDDELTSDVIFHFLKDKYNIDIAKNSKEALELVSKNQYSLILMDINLGRGITGIELSRMIRQLFGYEKIPIIASTAFAMVKDKEEFLASGLDDYISKPYSRNELFKVINRNL